jgi:1-aminocyclopropane-1-carboxylate deaminase/D-cysteine desulfhydrase-like pyridoxal-dependent ACC family enzyme
LKSLITYENLKNIANRILIRLISTPIMRQTEHVDVVYGHYGKINSDHIHAVKEVGLISIVIIQIFYDLSFYQLIRNFDGQDLELF